MPLFILTAIKFSIDREINCLFKASPLTSHSPNSSAPYGEALLVPLWFQGWKHRVEIKICPTLAGSYYQPVRHSGVKLKFWIFRGHQLHLL